MRNETKKKTVSPSTINREIACLKHMYNLAIDWNMATDNPTKKVKFFKESEISMRVLTKEEEEKLLMVSPPHLKNILITLLNTGMRLGEVMNLTWDKVNLKEKSILVEHTKTDRNRVIPINNILYSVLIRMKRTDIKVFCGRSGNPIKYIRKTFETALKKSDIKPCRIHDLRHTFATRLVMKRIDLATVKELLGHQDISTTMRYSHPTPDHKKWAVEVLGIDLDSPKTVPQEILKK